MSVSDLLKEKPLHFILIFLLILVSCTSLDKKTSVQDMTQDDYQFPELVQQEIIKKNSGNTKEYDLYTRITEEGPLIPGIFQSAVPQGMAYYSEEDLMLISNYMYDGRPSCITIVSMTSRRLIKTLWLLSPDGSPYLGHVGGLAVSKKHLWIASGKGVYYISLETIIKQNDNSNITMKAFVPAIVKGSFAGTFNGVLMVGEFTSKDGSYSTPASHSYKTSDKSINHAFIGGFILDAENDLINQNNKISGISYPDYILSIPDDVQGSAFIEGKIILSRSYGRKNNSRISVYSDVRKNPPDTTFELKDGKNIPVWILDNKSLEREITAPPMTEGVASYKESLAVLFESGSDKYRATAKNPQDRIEILSINF